MILKSDNLKALMKKKVYEIKRFKINVKKNHKNNKGESQKLKLYFKVKTKIK